MTGKTLTLSFNEIGFYLTRAAVGAGAPFGVAEDFANAVKWAVRLGMDPVPVALSLMGSRSSVCE